MARCGASPRQWSVVQCFNLVSHGRRVYRTLVSGESEPCGGDMGGPRPLWEAKSGFEAGLGSLLSACNL